MKKYFLFSLIIACAVRSFAQDVLTNKSIINLSKVGLSSTLIINKIKTSKCSFDLSTDALVALKEAKVSDDVITSMMDKQSVTLETGDPVADAIIRKLPQSGIYLYNPNADNYMKLDPTLVTGNKTSVGLTGTVKSKSELDGSEANVQTDKTAVFYFYFGQNKESKLNNTSASSTETKNEFIAMMQSYAPNQKSNEAFSPNDFKLIKLDKNKSSRYFETGRMSYYSGTSNGVSKNVQGFKYEAITPNLYKVYFPTGLPIGEYCFIYATSASSGGVTNSMMSNMGSPFKTDVKVFDFGVK